MREPAAQRLLGKRVHAVNNSDTLCSSFFHSYQDAGRSSQIALGGGFTGQSSGRFVCLTTPLWTHHILEP